jgi:hypothetical protein
MSVLNQILSKIAKDVLAPSVQAGVEAAAPAIANAMPATGGGLLGAAAGIIGMAGGGPVSGGIPGVDSVPLLGMDGEFMLDRDTVKRLGGPAGVEELRSGLARRGGFRLMAAGGPVNANAVVGADLLGVSQIPVLGAVVNLLVNVLLEVIGVQIEQRNTLTEMAQGFRDFRGELKVFADGRLQSDTSALTDRTGSSTQEAADERLRILKLVLDGLVKYIIENVIVPIAKAVGNTLLQVGSSAISGGLGAAFPGGSIVGSIIGSAVTSAGSAGIDIAAEVGTKLAESAISVGLDGLSQLLPSVMPGLTSAVFGGGAMAALADPITMALTTILGGLATVFTGIFGAAGTFDDGGRSSGRKGFLPKATIKPERVLSPSQTASFERLVDALTSGRVNPDGGGGNRVTIHAPFTVVGGEQGGRQVRDSLMALLS